MPFGILIIILPAMKKYPFGSIAELKGLLHSYFETSSDDPNNDLDDNSKKKRNDAEPLTMSGLAYHLGFKSVAEFETCETKGKFSALLKRARLRVETEYEKKLHFQSSTGAIFALKTLGWCERVTNNPSDDTTAEVFTVNVIHTGTPVATNEKDVKV